MRIVIDIPDEKQAETFLVWVANRGDMLLGDNCDWKPAEGIRNEDAKSRYVYVYSAAEVR